MVANSLFLTWKTEARRLARIFSKNNLQAQNRKAEGYELTNLELTAEPDSPGRRYLSSPTKEGLQ
jgi:hypothetical protein